MKELLTLNKLIYKYKGRIFLGALFIILANIIQVYSIRFVGKAINFIDNSFNNQQDNTDFNQLLLYGGLVILLPILSGIMVFLQRQTIIVASRYIEFDLKNDIFWHYQELDQTFYKKNRTGDLMNRISEDVGYVRQYLGPGIMYPINLVTLSIILIIEMLLIDRTLTLYTLAPLPILSIVIYFISSRINRKSREVQEEQSNLSSYVQDIFSGIRVVKSFNKEESIRSAYAIEAKNYKAKALSLANIQAFFFPMVLTIIGLSQILILYAGGNQYIEGNITDIGTLGQFFMYLNMLIWPFVSLGYISMVVQRAEASMKRINEFLSAQPLVKNIGNIQRKIEGEIEFNNVSFVYENTGIKALNRINLHILAGSTVAILGRTGSGKTTLAELIPRLYDPTEGDVKIDGIPLRDYELNSIRTQIGFVIQEAFLFSEKVKDNISFAVDDSNDALVQKYAKIADVHENIENFQEGYETKVGERGVTLSGGQKQRISIARALIKEPKILIFDDSLSAVDTTTEENIIKNIQENSKSKTTIVITHRISSAKHADKIIVLENGTIIQEGSHDELLLQQGEYKKLYEIQLQEDDSN
ncbi:ATP-binding cassette domain-containing protein [Flavobacteriaceae bacterium Ap0902]|nr:ATP-binding cassette domain-containing protein [Flavobacteriaceae bacterium Ap0902]